MEILCLGVFRQINSPELPHPNKYTHIRFVKVGGKRNLKNTAV